MASLYLFLFLGTICSSSVSAKFTTALTRVSKASLVPNTVLGIAWRSNTIDTLSLIEQGRNEEAKESLAQAALTLALLDLGGGAVLPVTEEITKFIQNEMRFSKTRAAFKTYNSVLSEEVTKAGSGSINKNRIRGKKAALKNALKLDIKKLKPGSKVAKAFNKASKWFRGASVFDVLGPLTDSLTIGLNIWGLDMAIKSNNPAGIASASLSIAAGVVGLTTFIAAVATGSALLGPIGTIAGAFLGLVATLVELITTPAYDVAAVEAYRARLQELRNLRDASISYIDWRMELMDKVGSPYTDVYVNNQAASLNDVLPNTRDISLKDCWSDKILGCPTYPTSLHLRKYMGSKKVEITDSPVKSKSLLFMGKERYIMSPNMPAEWSRTGWGKHAGHIGFDFYGKFKKGTSYKGVHVFINSSFVSEQPMNNINLNTDVIMKSNIEQDDVISIGEYRKLTKTKKGGYIKINTGYGQDCLNINGMLGEFHSDYENVLEADLGDGVLDSLSFQGISKERKDIKGVYFDSKTGVLKFYHGQNKIHTLGTVRGVYIFHGSPFDDHVILYHDDARIKEIVVFQKSGSNVYEFNFDDLVNAHKGQSKPLRFRIIDSSNNPPKINLKTSDANRINTDRMVLKYKKLIYYGTASSLYQPLMEITLDTAKIGTLFINNANPRLIDHDIFFPVYSDTGEKKILSFPPFPTADLQFGNGQDDALLLKWIAGHNQISGNYVVDMRGKRNYVIISEKYFLDPCGIDGETVTLSLNHGSAKGSYKISIEKPADPNFSFNIEINDIIEIQNEYGYTIFTSWQKKFFPIDLFEWYTRYTGYQLKVKTTEDVLRDD